MLVLMNRNGKIKNLRGQNFKDEANVVRILNEESCVKYPDSFICFGSILLATQSLSCSLERQVFFWSRCFKFLKLCA